jgi:hypothetical protein
VRLGLVTTRPLGEDLRVIGEAASTHDTLAGLQALAWVFDAADAAKSVEERELGTLGAEDVASFDALTIARAVGPVAEVLRAAAELELPLITELEGPSEAVLSAVASAIEHVLPAAPSLERFEIAVTPPLGLRGRMFGTSILVGLPGLGCPDAEHSAWQAAHEATVREVAILRDFPFLELERRALVLLQSRARAAGLGDAHGRWIARLDLSAFGPVADVDDATG